MNHLINRMLTDRMRQPLLLFLLPIGVTILLFIWLIFIYDSSLDTLWSRADQLGYRLYKEGQFIQSAQKFSDPAFKGSAFYRAGEFKKAAAVFATLTDASARYNLANSYLMMGKYPQAIEYYELALSIQPDFTQAKENKAVALARQAELDQHKGNDEGTGGQLEADEIVYDNTDNQGEEVIEQGAANEGAIAHWLDRLQTGPKQFLKHKFAYQLAHQKKNNKAQLKQAGQKNED